jgi:hypothetical protein
MPEYLSMPKAAVVLMTGVILLSSCKHVDVAQFDDGSPKYCGIDLERHRLVITITETNRVIECDLYLPRNYQMSQEYCGILAGYGDREWNMESRDSNRLEMNPSPVDAGITLEFNEEDPGGAAGRYL